MCLYFGGGRGNRNNVSLPENLSFKPLINKNPFSLENEKQVEIFKNHHLVMQSWLRVLFGKIGASHCCADKSINVI